MNSSFNSLTSTELLLLKKHIALGPEHLKNWLSDEEISALINFGHIDRKTVKKMQNAPSEMANSIVIGCNTIFSSVIGIWLGMNGFIEPNLVLPKLFFSLVIFCVLVGGFIGFLNYKVTKKKALKAIEKRRMHEVEMVILDFLTQKISKQIKQEVKKIHYLLDLLQIDNKTLIDLPLNELNENEICLNWINQAAYHMHNEKGVLAEIFFSEIEEIKAELQEKIDELQKRQKSYMYHIISKLPNTVFEPTSSSWIKKNLKIIFISIIPLAFSSFASLLVYLLSASQISQEWEMEHFSTFLTLPELKFLEMTLIFGIVIFLIYSFLRTNYKAFKRDQELSKINAKSSQRETDFHLLECRFDKVKRISETMKPVMRLYLLLKQI